MSPTWSPDGRYLVHDINPLGLFLFDLASRKETEIPNPPRGVIYGPADWQPIPGPKRSDYKNSMQFCQAERTFLGEVEFRTKHGTKSGANAFGRCVAQQR